jgi:hypothetical protein
MSWLKVRLFWPRLLLKMGAEPVLLIEKIVSGSSQRSNSVKTTEFTDGPLKGVKIHEGEAPDEKPDDLPYTGDKGSPHARLYSKVKIVEGQKTQASVAKPVMGIRALQPKPAKKIVGHSLIDGKVTCYFEDGTKEEK